MGSRTILQTTAIKRDLNKIRLRAADQAGSVQLGIAPFHDAVTYFTMYAQNFRWPVRTLRQ